MPTTTGLVPTLRRPRRRHDLVSVLLYGLRASSADDYGSGTIGSSDHGVDAKVNPNDGRLFGDHIV